MKRLLGLEIPARTDLHLLSTLVLSSPPGPPMAPSSLLPPGAGESPRYSKVLLPHASSLASSSFLNPPGTF